MLHCQLSPFMFPSVLPLCITTHVLTIVMVPSSGKYSKKAIKTISVSVTVRRIFVSGVQFTRCVCCISSVLNLSYVIFILLNVLA